MAIVKLPGSEGYDTQVSIISTTHESNISLAQ